MHAVNTQQCAPVVQSQDAFGAAYLDAPELLMTVVEIELRADIKVVRVRHFNGSGNRRLAVAGHSQLGRLDKQRQFQQMGRNR
ncbi:hypothetical protein D3C75_1296000 [compost metagenome]